MHAYVFLNLCSSVRNISACTCLYSCVHVKAYVNLSLCAYLGLCVVMCVCLNVSMDVCDCVCVYICMCMFCMYEYIIYVYEH